MKTFTIVFSALLTSSLVSVAHAATRVQEAPQRVVSYGDLDLNHEQGAERLYKRIRSAARDVCFTPGIMEVVQGPRMKQCAAHATARAVAEVNAPLLTRYHAERSGVLVDDEARTAKLDQVQRGELVVQSAN